MLITSSQAGEVLGLSVKQVANLIQSGKLKDYGKTEEGKKKHEFKLELDEVREYKRSLKQPKVTKVTAEPGIMSRLERIEKNLLLLNQQIKNLVDMWS